jgi:DnaJ-like protein
VIPREVIEQVIQDAIASGEFDNLPGAGKPLDLDAYFRTPEDVRMGAGLLKSAGYVPEEVALLKEISVQRTEREIIACENERAEITRQIEEKTVRLNLLMEQRKRRTRAP